MGTQTAVARDVGHRPVDVRVKEAMHAGVLLCTRDAPLSEVAWIMAEHRVHSVVVADDAADAGSLWGVVSDLDLVAAASVRNLDDQTAGASAVSPALIVSPRETLLRAAQIMTEHSTAHLVVIEPATGRPIGVLSTLDVVRALASAAAPALNGR